MFLLFTKPLSTGKLYIDTPCTFKSVKSLIYSCCASYYFITYTVNHGIMRCGHVVKSVKILMASFNFCDIINCSFSYITQCQCQCLYSTIKYITMQVYGTQYISSPQLLSTAALEFSLDGSQQQHRVHHNFKHWNIH
jgi:hypothetical protein